ncbi:MAG: manganese efflux pump [Eubacterium sp.]|nr:manganese efflux pump [Eubacterium sp.]
MKLNFMFFLNSVMLGAGLAMDAFSVSVANALANPQMKKRKMLTISGIFGIFQFIMPLIGWLCVKTVVNYFKAFEKFIPYIALILLVYIGGKMIFDSIRQNEDSEPVSLGAGTLIVQGIATSIDALSVGFTIEKYSFTSALVSCLIIFAITFAICLAGLIIGKNVGNKYSKSAQIIGGIILIAIGIEIFIKGII